jgi:superfamily II DNA or RNA helicase
MTLSLFDKPSERKMLLRDYQQHSVDGGMNALRSRQSAFIEVATGMGKTAIAAALSEQFDKVLISTPYDATVGQVVSTVKRYRRYVPEIEQGPLMADPECPVTVASLASLISNNRYERFLGKTELLIIDEAHASLGPRQAELVAAFKAAGTKIIGMSATPHYRTTGVSPLHQYDCHPVSIGMRQGIEWGWLVPFNIRRIVLKKLDMSRFGSTGAHDFSVEELDRIMGEEGVMLEQTAMIAANHKRKGVVFTTGIRNARAMQDILENRHGIQCAVVDSEMPKEKRVEQLARFEEGDAELIVNVGCLTTGWDSPQVGEIHNLRPTKSLPKYIQMLGRGARPSSNDVFKDAPSDYSRRLAIRNDAKPNCDVYDYTDASKCHCICSAVDVFVPPTKKRKAYVEDMIDRGEPVTMEDVDAAVAAEMEQERQAAVIHRQEELARRRPLVFRAEVDSQWVDAFKKGTSDIPKRREARMIWGPYKGIPIRMIPADYLKGWIKGASKRPGNEWLVEAVKRELNRVANERRQTAGR